MPPRTTRKSYRPRVSDRTMVDTLRPRCLFAPETEGRRHANGMNLRNRENRGSSLQHTGWISGRISPFPPVEGEVFFLTSPFIERACFESSGKLPTTGATSSLRKLVAQPEIRLEPKNNIRL